MLDRQLNAFLHRLDDCCRALYRERSPAIDNAAAPGLVILERRLALHLRKEDVAAQSGVSIPTVCAIENDKTTAPIGLVLQICRDLGLRLTVCS